MDRMESDRAADVTDEARTSLDAIFSAGWELSLGDPAIRWYGVGAACLLAVIVACAVALIDGGLPAVGVFAALLAPTFAAVLVVGGLRAAVLELTGDVRHGASDARDVLCRAIVRAPEVVVASTRALTSSAGRSPLTAAVVVVNGVGAPEAARTSRALVAHRWGPRTRLAGGVLVGVTLVAPVALVDTLFAIAWSHVGLLRLPLLVLAAVATIAAVVVAVALDAGLRGALLRVARGDEAALAPGVARRIIRPS